MADAPKTLLQMAGAPLDPSPLSESTLVIIDAQNEYRSGALPLTGVDAALGEIEALLKRARAAGAPVIHVQHKGKPGGAFDLDDERGRIVRELAPACAEPVVQKPLPNAFADRRLHDPYVRELDRPRGARPRLPRDRSGRRLRDPRPAGPGRRRDDGNRPASRRADRSRRPLRDNREGRGGGAGLSRQTP
jgi:hypothetical protein